MVKVVEASLTSALMRREMPYRILLPQDVQPDEPLPVLYLLHGLFGACDNWLELTRITAYADQRNFAVVLVEGGDGWYTDSATVEDEKYESYFTIELLPEVEQQFNLGGSRGKRGIAGLSMGGYGALKFAFMHPNAFVFAGSTSGAFEAPLRTEGSAGFDWEILGPSVSRAFGAQNTPARDQGDLLMLLRDALSGKVELPYIYLDCGIDDAFIGINRGFAKLLKTLKIRHEYHESAGGHDWTYWNAQSLPILDVFEETISSLKSRA